MLLYVPEMCRSRRRLDLESVGLEIVWIEMRLKRKSIVLGNMYRPPNAGISSLDTIGLMMEKVVSERKDVVLMGDLNVNLLSSSSSAEKLLLATSENNLKQLITEPTRCTNHSQPLLDVLFTSSPDLFSSAGCVEFTGSDYLMIYGECLQEVPVQSKVCTVRSFKKCNVEELSVELMDAPWQVMVTFNDVNDMWYYWKSLFLDVLDKHALLKVRRKMRGNDDWLDSGLRSLMRSRNYYRRKHRKTRAVEDWERFKALRNEVNRRVRVAKVEYYQSICKNISKQPRSTWS